MIQTFSYLKAHIGKGRKEEDDIKGKLIKEDSNCNDCILKNHWNKLEWVGPKRINMNINSF